MAYADPAVRRQRDRERIAQRTAARIEAGLCARCGKTEPLPERRLCAPCNDTRNAASRARDARLRAEGKPRRDPAQAKRYERERSRQVHAERKAAGICTKCGKAPARPERTTCEPCAEQHRARDRERHARAKADGIPYGGRDPEARRRAGRKRSRRRSEARKEAGLCIRCGHVAPQEGRAMCEPCREDRRAAKRARHAERRAAGLCVHCAAPAPGGKAYCEPCAKARSKRRNLEAKREADRRRYAERRARGDCTSCGKPAQGAAECQACCDAARGPLRRPPGRRGLRQVPDAHPRRDGLLRALRRRQGRAPRPRGGIRRQARPVCRTAGQGPLCRMRRAVARRGALRTVFAQAPRELGGIPRHSGLGPHLDGDRDRHGRGPGHLRQRGRRRALPRLREAPRATRWR